MRAIFRAIRLRLTLWYVAVLAAILIAVSTGLYAALYRQMLGAEDLELRQAAEFARMYLPSFYENGEEEGEEDHELDDDEPLAATLLWTYIVTPDGRSRAGNAPADPAIFPDRTVLRRVGLTGRAEFSTRMTTVTGRTQTHRETIRLYTMPVQDVRGRLLAVIQSGKPITPVLAVLNRIFLILLVTAAFGLILAGAGGLFLADRALVPIRQAFHRQREFVADASHELRTPLSIVRASAELLDRELAEAPAETRELVENVLSESNRMGRLVSDLLTLARADSGESDIERRPFDLVPVANSALRKASLLARNKEITLDTHLPASLAVNGDAAWLEQLLLILLDNAIKYTGAGGRVALSLQPRRDQVELSVSDTGIGIPAGDLPRIFERFYRVDKARSRAQGGTGLGLAIARWIVDAHSGTIHVMSTPGQGATFTITLPA